MTKDKMIRKLAAAYNHCGDAQGRELIESVIKALSQIKSELVYQVELDVEDHQAWTDAPKETYDCHATNQRRILYTAPPELLPQTAGEKL